MSSRQFLLGPAGFFERRQALPRAGGEAVLIFTGSRSFGCRVPECNDRTDEKKEDKAASNTKHERLISFGVVTSQANKAGSGIPKQQPTFPTKASLNDRFGSATTSLQYFGKVVSYKDPPVI